MCEVRREGRGRGRLDLSFFVTVVISVFSVGKFREHNADEPGGFTLLRWPSRKSASVSGSYRLSLMPAIIDIINTSARGFDL